MVDNKDKRRRAIQLGALLAVIALIVLQQVQPARVSSLRGAIQLVLLIVGAVVFVWTRRLPRAFETRSNVRPTRKRREIARRRKEEEAAAARDNPPPPLA